ncbi:hypothetical protein HDV00_007593 [Rhizophlyctis rosea]|nr:hypothetical protein HDV00_007593 [Rhizophlyctis rosea]
MTYALASKDTPVSIPIDPPTTDNATSTNDPSDFTPATRYRPTKCYILSTIIGWPLIGVLAFGIIKYKQLYEVITYDKPDEHGGYTGEIHNDWTAAVVALAVVGILLAVLCCAGCVMTGTRLGSTPHTRKSWKPSKESREPQYEDVNPRWIRVNDVDEFIEGLKGRETVLEISKERMPIERWEDVTDEREWKEVERVLREGKFGVLRLTIIMAHSLESDTLRHSIDTLTTEYGPDLFKRLTARDELPQTTAEDRNEAKDPENVGNSLDGLVDQNQSEGVLKQPGIPNADVFKSIITPVALVPSFSNHPALWPTYTRPEDDPPFVQKTTLFLYRGVVKPWWTSDLWYYWWYLLHLGGIWEWWVGFGGYGVKEVVIKRALY